MRTKSTVAAFIGSLALGAGGAYLAGATGSPQPIPAQSPPAETQPAGDSMMGGDRGSIMTQMMGAEHAKMMRDPGVRQMHQAMLGQHKRMLRDPAMRHPDHRAMRNVPEMARMMREHMKG